MLLFEDVSLLHDAVALLRCLRLRDTSPSQWDTLMQLQSHAETRRDIPDTLDRVMAVANFVIQDLRVPSVDLALIEHLTGVLDVNSFEVPKNPGSEATVQAVYPGASLV